MTEAQTRVWKNFSQSWASSRLGLRVGEFVGDSEGLVDEGARLGTEKGGNVGVELGAMEGLVVGEHEGESGNDGRLGTRGDGRQRTGRRGRKESKILSTRARRPTKSLIRNLMSDVQQHGHSRQTRDARWIAPRPQT
jgi:hypothetical protein